MSNAFSSICQMNLVNPPQPCSSRRSHRVEFQFSNNSRLHVFVCERHASNVACIEKALASSGEFPEDACLVAISTCEISTRAFSPARLAVAGAE